MLFSVVMAAYNAQEYIQESIDSILNQTYRQFEFIIVNDGSTDDTRTILEQQSDERIRVIHLEHNEGLANALNRGIDAAAGDWIFRQDADDISLPTRLEKQIAFIEAHPDVIVLGSHVECFSEQEAVRPNRMRGIQRFHNKMQNGEHLKNERFRSCPLSHGSCVFLKKAFLEAGRYNPEFRIVQDYDLWMRMFELGPIEIVPEILYQYRVNLNSLSHRSQTDFTNECSLISTSYIRKLFDENIQPLFIVIGPEKNCRYFKLHVEPYVNFEVYGYVHHPAMDHFVLVNKLYSEGIIDAVIVLDPCKGNSCSETVGSFIHLGMKYNQNLFCIYNVIPPGYLEVLS